MPGFENKAKKYDAPKNTIFAISNFSPVAWRFEIADVDYISFLVGQKVSCACINQNALGINTVCVILFHLILS